MLHLTPYLIVIL